MNKFLSLILSVSMIYACSDNKKIYNSLTEQNLKGKVKHISASVYDATYKFGEVQKGNLIERYSNKYNKDGYQLEFNSYRPDGSLKSSNSFKYDNHGNQIEHFFTNSDGSYIDKDRSEYKYDANGNQIEKSINDFNGRLRTKYQYKYDNIGNLIEQDSYASDNSHYNKIKFEYNSNNSLIEKNIYKPDGSLSKKLKYDYVYFPDNKVREFEEKYYNSYGQLSNTVTQINDSLGNVIETIEYYTESDKTYKYTFNYKYDLKGNWIMEVEFENEEPFTITDREIEYFP